MQKETAKQQKAFTEGRLELSIGLGLLLFGLLGILINFLTG